MRTNHWLLGGALLAALHLCGHDAVAQAHPATGHPGAPHGAQAHPHPAAAAPASAAPVNCEAGEHADHGQCCPIGADWVPASHRCMNHNRRQALVQVVIANPPGPPPANLTVTLDGNPVPGTPPTISVPPGSHALQVNATDVRPVQQQLSLTAGQVDRVQVQLESTVGRVQINVSTEGAQVTVDDHAIAGLPPVAEGLAPGVHHVHVTAPDHTAVDRDVTVAAGQTATVDVGELPVPSAPPLAAVAVTAPVPTPPSQTLFVEALRSGQHFDVEVQSGSQTYRCDAEVTHDAPCTLHDVPAGVAHVNIHGSYNTSDDVQVPVGHGSLQIDFQPSSVLRGAYLAVGIALFIPTIATFIAAGTCGGGSTECNSLWYVGIGLAFVPGILPGAFLIATGAREQGSAHLTIRRPEEQARYFHETLIASPAAPAMVRF